MPDTGAMGHPVSSLPLEVDEEDDEDEDEDEEEELEDLLMDGDGGCGGCS